MHPTCLNGKACGHNDPLCLISLLLCFSSGLFLGVPKKEGGRKTIAVTAHAASRLHAPEGRRRALTSTIQTRSTVNTGTLHRTAALHGKCPVSVINRKEVGDSRLSPGVSAGRSETAPGISTVTRSAKDIIRKGVHCIGWCFLCCIQQVRERQPELDTSDGSNFCYYPLCKLRLSCTGVTFGETSPRNVS